MTDLVNPVAYIISRLWLCCARHTNYLRKLKENKNLLSTAMDELKETKDDVQRRVDHAEADLNEPKKRTDQVRGWLQRVQIIEGKVELILRKGEEQLLNRGRCLGVCCPPNNCWSNYKVGKSIVKKIPLVNELKGKGDFQELTDQLPPSSVQGMNLELTVGMESMFDKVWRLVTNTDDQAVNNIIGLYGKGGVGKTTLLEKINNEFHKKISTGEHGFDHVVMFMVVSKPINYAYIQKKIGERLGLSLQQDEEEQSRAQKIFNALRNKNYVLLLDDIWEKVDKKRIGIPIHPQGNSKLIFTTRSIRVCGDMEATHKFQVECLPWDKAWRLFRDKVGEDALTSFPRAHELAMDVAKECGGLPLALITIGRAMSTKKTVEEWTDAIITLRSYASDFEGMSDEVLPCLKLSYDYLHNETYKSCFRYCALFPEDHSIEIAQIVDIWIAEGLLNGFDNLSAARSRGHTIIGSLKSACLLESSDEVVMKKSQEKTHVKMHDVIRDLALWIVNDCRSSDERGNNSYNKFLVAENDPCNKWENAERIFWDATHYKTRNNNNHPPTSPNLPTLKSLIVRNMSRSWSLILTFFQHMPLLRVLDLSHTGLEDFPISICELHELQYLNLSRAYMQELPAELRKLVKLKFLVLFNTINLRRIPVGLIANLSELQVLDLGSNYNHISLADREMEDGPSYSELDGLKQLQEVRITFYVTTIVALEKFLCNRKLQMVCTGVTFHNSLSSSSSIRVLDLSNFKSPKDLKLFGGFPEMEKLVLYGGNLETLSLYDFHKLNNVLWMVVPPDVLHSHFQSLHYISIRGCNALKDLTWLVYVLNLETVFVQFCYGLETIMELGDQMLNIEEGGGVVFRRLKTLYLGDLQQLKSICRHALAFPSIETIEIDRCPKLKKLPLDSCSNVNHTLKQIKGETEWWNELQWKDKTIKSKFLPYFNQRLH